MIKEIKYNGFSASPGDHEAIEGDLCVAMNLIPEHGTIRPVLPPSTIASIPGDYNLPNDKGRKIVCIHQTSAFKHYIVAIDYEGLYGTPFTYLYSWEPDASTMSRIGDTSFKELHNVEPVGNTLVVLADDGIHYYLWKQGDYYYLGNHLPELDLQFSMDEHSMTISSDEHDLGQIIYRGNFFTWIYDPENKETLDRLRQAIMASTNQVVGTLTEQRMLCFPFFVRYAFRLYDDTSVTMHSAPCLMIPTMDKPDVDMGWTIFDINAPTAVHPKVKATFSGYGLWCRGTDQQARELAQWSDIISSVDIFISTQFYTYKQDPNDDEIIIGNGDSYNQPPDNPQLNRQIVENGNFYLIKQIPVRSDPNGQDARLRSHGGEVKPDFEPSNENIVVRERMSDDNGSHDHIIAEKSFAYNNRINLAGISKRLFSGFNPACMWVRKDVIQTQKRTTATVVVDIDGREIVVRSDEAQVMFNGDNDVVWFYYPNTAAKSAYLDIDGNKVMLHLLPHSMLNGAYYCSLDEDAEQNTVGSIPAPSSDEENLVSLPNKVYTSEVNNPFYFPSTGVNSIGTGEIKGICAAVRPMSSGQYGYADLYIFADNGIWTAEINEKGTYGNLDLATGDVCLNPDSITQMETSVLFTTNRGIMLISGSHAQCISEAIDDDGQPFSLDHPAVDDMATMLSLDVDIRPFKDFVQECRMIYDYPGQRIIAYNPDFNYAYIYSLESNKWGMMQSNIDYSVRAYPEAIAVNRDGDLMDCSVGDGSAVVSQMLITRPLSLDLPDVQKTVRAVLQRGLFAKRQGHVRSILFASRDMMDWFSMMSSKDEDMRGFSGTGFKWFRVGLLLQLQPHESIQGCSIQFDTKYTNRLR